MSDDGKDKAPAPRVMNPLWVVSLFLGLSETTVGLAATQAHGWVQGLLAVFAVVFPVPISAAFFAILWRRPENLYAPGDYPSHVEVSAFVESIRRDAPSDRAILGEVMRDTLEKVLPPALERQLPPEDVARAIEEVIATAEEDLDKRLISVDASELWEGLTLRDYPYSDSSQVSDFLFWISRALQIARPEGGYGGAVWVITDVKTGRVFRDIGSRQLRAGNLRLNDMRSLRDVGITPDSELALWVTHRPTQSAVKPASFVEVEWVKIASFDRDYAELGEKDRTAFGAALRHFMADLHAGSGFSGSLRVRRIMGADDIWEMAWSSNGRATFQISDDAATGKREVVWRRIGRRDILEKP